MSNIANSKNIKRIQRVVRVLQLKKMGHSLREIAYLITQETEEWHYDYLITLRNAEGEYLYSPDTARLEMQLNPILKNYGHNDVYRDLMGELQALKQQSIEDAKALRELECSRLDDMLQGIYEQAKAGDLGAIDRVLKIGEQRQKILGLNAPIDIRMKEIIYQKMQVQFDAFFGKIYADRKIPEHIKERLLAMASEFENSELLETEGGMNTNYEA